MDITTKIDGFLNEAQPWSIAIKTLEGWKKKAKGFGYRITQSQDCHRCYEALDSNGKCQGFWSPNAQEPDDCFLYAPKKTISEATTRKGRLKNDFKFGSEYFDKGYTITIVGEEGDKYIVKKFAIMADGPTQKINKNLVQVGE